MPDPRYSHTKYLIRKKFFNLFGSSFRIFDPTGQQIMYAKMKAFKLKEDIRLYTDESMTFELLTIKARQILDFSAAYDVVDATTGEKVGALKRKGMKSIVRDEWIIMDAQDREIGTVSEDNLGLALARRFLSNLIPQTFRCFIGGQKVATFKQHFNIFVLKITADFSADISNLFDRRLGLATGILLSAIEKRQR